MPSNGISGHGDAEEGYPGHRWHFPLSRLAMAAKAAGLAAIDAPYGDFKDQVGLKRTCEQTVSLGFDGKWAIHPAQLEIINDAFTPEPADIDRARRVLRAYEQARATGVGATSLDGKMVDRASIRLARITYEQAQRLGLIGKERE
jgi:citrate lyase beta subunit